MGKSPDESEAWRILLFGRNGAELLLVRSPSGIRLPELRVPRWQRIVPNLNAEAKRRWNLDTVCLFPFDVPYADPAAVDCKYHVMEACKPEQLARVAPDLVPLSSLKEASFADRRDYLAIQQGTGCKGASFPKGCQGPFAALGAFARISAWVEEQLRPRGIHCDGSFQQLQATPSFALIRWVTNHGAVWFKAVGACNAREFSITRLLASRHPQYVPQLLAAKTDWNAWLAAEAPGQGLFESSDPATWCRAAEFLADLQMASLQHVSEFFAAGAHDMRSQKLLDTVAPFFAVMEETMQAQTKTTVTKLNIAEIRRVREQVSEALHKLDRYKIPNTLNNLDLNPANVVVSTNSCAFLDWAEAAVGNPLFSFEYLRQQFLQLFPGRIAAEAEFHNSYQNRWKPVLADQIAKDVFVLVPLTAVFAFAISLRWDDCNLCQHPELAAFLRSLVRRMQRESDQIRDIRAA